MRKIFLTLAIIILAIVSGFAQFDTIIPNGNNGKTFIIPNNKIPDRGTYKIGIQDSGTFTFKLQNFISGTTQFNMAGICGVSFTDSATTCGPGTYVLNYTNKSNNALGMDMIVDYFVNIIDRTTGSLTFGQTPDTVWVKNPKDSATLSVGTNFVTHNWIKFGIYVVYNSNNSVKVPIGTWIAACSDNNNYASRDTIVVAYKATCTSATYNRSFSTCSNTGVTIGKHTYKTPGTFTYHDTLTASTGCDSIIVSTVTTYQTYNIPKSATICKGENYDGHTTAGMYTYKYTSCKGCDSIISLNLTVNDVPKITLQPAASTTKNVGESVTLSTNSSGPTATYHWMKGSTEIGTGKTVTINNLKTTDAGSYNCIVINTCGSTPTNMATLTVNCITYNISKPDTICQGDSIVVAGISCKTAGDHIILLNSIYGCDSTVTINLTVNQPPTVDLGKDTVSIVPTQFTILDAGTNCKSYSWSTGEHSQTIIVSTTGWYFVTVTNDCGSAQDSTYLDVITSISSLSNSVQLKAFSSNDHLYIQSKNRDQNLIEVYNLNGQKVINILNYDSSLQIDISNFPNGIYILKIGEYKLKFAKL